MSAGAQPIRLADPVNLPTNEDLIRLLRCTEHSFVERKLHSDTKDWLKTVVAFANSTPIGYPAVLFIGARDDGTPEQRSDINFDTVQKTLSDRLGAAYPAIYYTTRIIDVDGFNVLAVVVPGSRDRPHFAGRAYIRDGSKTIESSRAQFDRLIAERNGKAAKILEWLGRTVKMGQIRAGEQRPSSFGSSVIVTECNQFWVTLAFGDNNRIALPLGRLELSFDCRADCLVLIEQPA